MRAKVLLFTTSIVLAVSSFSPPVWASGGGETPSSYFGIPTQIWLPLNLALFLFLLGKLIWGPLRSFLDSRSAAITSELEEAQRKLGEAEELRTQVLSRLEKVETEVSEIKERAERDGEAEADRIGDLARIEEERFLKRVEDEIARRQAETRKELAEETAELTAQMTRELLAKEMTAADRKRVLDRSLAAMQALQEKS